MGGPGGRELVQNGIGGSGRYSTVGGDHAETPARIEDQSTAREAHGLPRDFVFFLNPLVVRARIFPSVNGWFTDVRHLLFLANARAAIRRAGAFANGSASYRARATAETPRSHSSGL